MSVQEYIATLRGHDDRLRAYAYLLVGSLSDVVLHDAYVGAHRDGDRLSDAQAARNRLFGRVQMHALARLPAAPPAPERPGRDAPLPEVLDVAVRSVPFAERGALLLVVREGMSLEIASQQLRVPADTVAADVAAARHVLRQRVPDLDVDDDAALSAALGELPVPAPPPTFWSSLERDIGRDGSNAHAPPEGADRRADRTPRPRSRWLIMVGLLIVLLVTGGVIWFTVATDDDADVDDAVTLDVGRSHDRTSSVDSRSGVTRGLW